MPVQARVHTPFTILGPDVHALDPPVIGVVPVAPLERDEKPADCFAAGLRDDVETLRRVLEYGPYAGGQGRSRLPSVSSAIAWLNSMRAPASSIVALRTSMFMRSCVSIRRNSMVEMPTDSLSQASGAFNRGGREVRLRVAATCGHGDGPRVERFRLASVSVSVLSYAEPPDALLAGARRCVG
jgi:hypothetical protein